MTKRDIANAVAAKTGIPAIQAQEVVQKTMDAIVAALIAERRIELRDSVCSKSRNGRHATDGILEPGRRSSSPRDSS